MGGGEAPPHDPAEAEAAINAEADKAGAAGNSDLMAKLKSAATNKKIQGAFMDVKNNGVSAAMKYKDDAERVEASQGFSFILHLTPDCAETPLFLTSMKAPWIF